MNKRTAMRRVGLGLVAAGSMVLPLLSNASATATPAPTAVSGAAAGVNCVVPPKQQPKARRGPDHSHVSAADAARIQRELAPTKAAINRGSRSARIAPAVMIPVYAHVIWGKHAGERDFGRQSVHRAIDKLNQGFSGDENGGRYGTRYIFRLYGVDFTTSEWQYHAAPMSPGDQYMKRTHHRGHRWSLNLYFAEPDGGQQALLGWARFPWEYDRNPRLDGVVIHPETVVGRPYDPALDGFQGGDTTTHEVGHWLGLFHVFQGGCRNLDYVADTPAQAYPIYHCVFANRPDTCSGKRGKDAVRNYMGYAIDQCINHFTHGQASRMDAAWLKYRARSTH